MSYLDRLKALSSERNAPTSTVRTAKSPFDSFDRTVGSRQSDCEANKIATGNERTTSGAETAAKVRGHDAERKREEIPDEVQKNEGARGIGASAAPAENRAPTSAHLGFDKKTCKRARPSKRADEGRRQRVMTFLGTYPNVQRAVVTDAVGESDFVVVTVAVRDVGIGEIELPKAGYDASALMTLLDKYAGGDPGTSHRGCDPGREREAGI